MVRVAWCGVVVAACAALGGCKPAASSGAPVVVVTTTMLADMARELGGEGVQVRGLMQPGGDPHLYQPTPRDAAMVAGSALVITSGLGLEGWIDDLVRNAGGQRPIVVAGKGVAGVKMEGTGAMDPHFWFDVKAWSLASDEVAQGLIVLAGPDAAQVERVRARHAVMKRRLEALDKWTAAQMATIPKGQRVLVTSHDAFHYFGRAYGVEVVGIQGLSTEQQAGQRDLVRVIERIKADNIPAVFVETTVNPQLIERVAADTGVSKLGPLFSDSIGPQGTPGGSYAGMITENVRMICEGLGGSYAPFVAPEQAL
jgi:ABC-type Zn uptake system ZnuABC Zn-binding protein ZnuA